MPYRWYMRPVLFVADVQRAIDFYVDELGFAKKWHQDGVCQVPTRQTWWSYDVLRIDDPDGNELLVCLENLLPERN